MFEEKMWGNNLVATGMNIPELSITIALITAIANGLFLFFASGSKTI